MNLAFVGSVSLKFKLAVVFAVVLILFSAALLFVVNNLIVTTAEEAAEEKARGDLATGEMIINQMYPGDWRVAGDLLYKGDVLMNNNFEVVDLIGRLTGDTVTIFRWDTRITTNVIDQEGKRAVGTTVSDEVAEAVLNRGVEFYGTANVVGHWYVTGYKPIRDASGETVGIWYVGAPKGFVDALIHRGRVTVLGAGAVTLVISLALLMFVTNRIIANPLNQLELAAGKMATGELDHRVQVGGRDEVGRLGMAFNQMGENLKNLVDRVQENSYQLAEHSQELSAASEEVSAAVQNVTATSNELAASTEQATAHTEQAAEAAKATDNASEAGNQAVQQAIGKITAIQNTVNSSAKSVENLHQQSEKIGQIIQVINDIADQTNLLALNAAIEAARAGEHGRGFAVVADEVRKLAEKSSGATKEIETIIRAIQKDTVKAVETMQTGASEVDEGVEIIKRAGKALENIRENAGRSTDLVAEITQLSEQNSQGVQNLAASAEQVSSTIQEMASNANNLARMADELEELVKSLRKA
ncbi:MAG: methyl-accepting chemotaxis protein [Candidatus Desulforudis sp.]|nr:methyl-accepting chemotaxis protein [Desulforudis sp.]